MGEVSVGTETPDCGVSATQWPRINDSQHYAGAITIGGLIERGDIHRALTADPTGFGGVAAGTLDPDQLAESV